LASDRSRPPAADRPCTATSTKAVRAFSRYELYMGVMISCIRNGSEGSTESAAEHFHSGSSSH
jgi:hypothetical protein